jgi:hypothetical protein
MRVIIFLHAILISFISLAYGASDLDSRIEKFKELQKRVGKECLNNPKAQSYSVTFEGRVVKCEELILITEQLRLKIDKEVAELKTCEAAPSKDQHVTLAANTGKIIEKTESCKPAPDQGQCLKKFGCSIIASAAPIKAFMHFSGKSVQNPRIKQCLSEKNDNDCMSNVLRGIFDSLWSSVELIWDLGKAAVLKTAELFGMVKESEAKTSERAMAAQQASPSFLKSLKNDPVETLQKMASNLYESMEAAAIDHYGCEKWAGIPFTSKCLAPMSTWNCASCAQKSQVFCGIAGYAVGEIGSAMITGGLLAGGKSVVLKSVKLASSPARNVAAFMSKTFPKSSARISQAGQKLGAVATATLTKAEKASVATWNKLADSKFVAEVSSAASKISKSTVGQIVGTGFKPIEWYLKAMDNAFKVGFEAVDGFGKAKSVTTEVLRGSKLADEAVKAEKPTIIPLGDQTAATPGLVVIEKRNEVTYAPQTPKFLKQRSYRQETIPVAPATKTSNKPVAGLLDGTEDLSLQMTKFKTDPEYVKLFKGPKLYDTYHDELTAVIMTLEKTQPNLSKAGVRKYIEGLMNSCAL